MSKPNLSSHLTAVSKLQSLATTDLSDDLIDEGGEGGIIDLDPFTATRLVEAIREGHKNFGTTPNSDITLERLKAKTQQGLAERGEMAGMQNSGQEPHPIIADSPYFSGIDQAVNPSIEFMTEEEAQRHEEELQYQQRKRLERQMKLGNSAAPILTRS